jgi:hypothetical protein
VPAPVVIKKESQSHMKEMNLRASPALQGSFGTSFCKPSAP